jgi:hypothetical protein
MGQFTRCMAAWMACAAVLMASLTPSISHALAAGLSSVTTSSARIFAGTSSQDHLHQMSHDASLEDETNSDGMQMEGLRPQGSHVPGPHSSESHFEHCPFCFTHAGSFALPPTTALLAPAAVSNSDRFASLFYQSPFQLFIWTTAQSRAPPVIS